MYGKLFESSISIQSFQIKLVTDETPQFETILEMMFHMDEILIYFNFNFFILFLSLNFNFAKTFKRFLF